MRNQRIDGNTMTTLAFASIGWIAAAMVYHYAARGIRNFERRVAIARWAVVLAVCLSIYMVGLLSLDGAWL